MSAYPLPIGASDMVQTLQRQQFYLENHFVWLVKYDFKPRFHIVKYKYVKEIHFGIILLAKKFILSMIVRIFAPSVLAKPLNNAQMCEAFLFLWVYGNKNSVCKNISKPQRSMARGQR